SKVSVVLPPPMAWRKTPPRFGWPSWAAANLAGTAASRPAAPVPARNCRRLKSGLFRNLVILSHPLLDHLVARCPDRPRGGRCVSVPAGVIIRLYYDMMKYGMTQRLYWRARAVPALS